MTDILLYFLRSICTSVFEFLRVVQKLDITSNTSGHKSTKHWTICPETMDQSSRNRRTTCLKRTNYMSIHIKIICIHTKMVCIHIKWYVHAHKMVCLYIIYGMYGEQNCMYTYEIICIHTKWYVRTSGTVALYLCSVFVDDS